MPTERYRRLRRAQPSFFSTALYCGKLLGATTLGFAAGCCLIRHPGVTLAVGAATYLATRPSLVAKLL